MVVDFFTLAVFFVAGASILIGAGHLFLAQAGRKKYYWSIAYFSTGWIFFYGFFVFAERLADFPHLYGPHISAVFLPGYFYYAYFRNWLNPQAKEHHWFFLSPFLAALALTTPGFFAGGAEKREAILGYYQKGIFSWRESLFMMGFAYNAIFPVLISITVGRLFKEIKGAERGVRMLVYICAFLCVVSIAAIIVGHILFNMLIIKIAAGGFLIAACCGYFFMLRSAHTNVYLQAAEAMRYKQSRLSGIDIDDVAARLESLMNVDKIFTDYELTMQVVAQKIGIKPQQLSEFLNLHLQVSFRDYLNRHRIEEAKRLLAESAPESVLQVAFQSGFGSKSSFNEIFRKATGRTPSVFLEESRRV